MKESSMQAAQQTQASTNFAPLMKFYSDGDKTAWLNGRTPDQLEVWEQACVECGYLPPATKDEFMAATKDDTVYPDLEAWRVAFMSAQFEANVRELMAAEGAPAEVIDAALAELREKLGAKMADVNINNVKMLKLTGEAAKDLDIVPPDLLDALMGDGEPDPEKIIKLVKVLVEVEKSMEREACAKMIEAMDPVAGKRFAEAIRFRDAEEKARRQCDCAKCTAKRAAAAESTTN
jgi:hypothetical protein